MPESGIEALAALYEQAKSRLREMEAERDALRMEMESHTTLNCSACAAASLRADLAALTPLARLGAFALSIKPEGPLAFILQDTAHYHGVTNWDCSDTPATTAARAVLARGEGA